MLNKCNDNKTYDIIDIIYYNVHSTNMMRCLPKSYYYRSIVQLTAILDDKKKKFSIVLI